MTEKQASTRAAGESFHPRKADQGRWFSVPPSCTVSTKVLEDLSTVFSTFSAEIHTFSHFRVYPSIIWKSGQGLGLPECAASAAS